MLVVKTSQSKPRVFGVTCDSIMSGMESYVRMSITEYETLSYAGV